ncbi:hypothetical protein ACWA7J_13980 [Leptothrix sp. BB-4]
MPTAPQPRSADLIRGNPVPNEVPARRTSRPVLPFHAHGGATSTSPEASSRADPAARTDDDAAPYTAATAAAAAATPGTRSTASLPAAADVLDLPQVGVRTAKVVNALGQEVALQLMPLHDAFSRHGSVASQTDLSGWIDGLCHLVLSVGLRVFGEDQPVFIGVREDVMTSSLVDVLSPRWAVIQLPTQVLGTPALLERLQGLRERGLSVSLSCNGATAARLQQLDGQVDSYHLDIGTHDRGNLAGLWPELRGRPLHLRGIDRLDVFREYRSQGVHAFSGPLLAAPVTWTADQLPACDPVAVERLHVRMVQGADDAELAILIERDPALALRVMLLACDGLCGAPTRPGSIEDMVARLRSPTGAAWLQVFEHEARQNQACRRPVWAAEARHLSTFLRLLIERLSPERHELQRQATLLGQLAYFRHTLPSRMVSHPAMPLAAPAIEDAWLHRQCLLGAVLDIGLRLMFDASASSSAAGGMSELFDIAGRMVREQPLADIAVSESLRG